MKLHLIWLSRNVLGGRAFGKLKRSVQIVYKVYKLDISTLAKHAFATHRTTAHALLSSGKINFALDKLLTKIRESNSRSL